MELTKQKVLSVAMVAAGLAAVYFLTKNLSTLFLVGVGIGVGWYLKGKFGDKVEDLLPKKK